MATAEDTGWADNVDYGDSDDDDGLNAKMEMSKTDDEDEDDNQDNNWADDVDYGDDNDDDDDDGIGDLDLSDDDGLDDDLPQTGGPMGSPMSASNFKSEITSTLDNPNKIGISYKLILDPRDTPGDISDDDETAPGLRINHFQLLSSKQMAQENKDNDYDGDISDDTILGTGAFAKVFRARDTKNGRMVALKCMYKNLLRKQFLMKSRYNLESDDDTPQMIRHTMLDAVQIELQIMMKIKHINIVRLYYVIDDPTIDSLYLSIEYSPFGQVMDFEGKLLQYIPNKKIKPSETYIISNDNVSQPWWYNKYVAKSDEDKAKLREKVERFNEDTAKKLFMDCLKGLEYLHDNNIIHRDLKPENMLLYVDDTHPTIKIMVKLADFGTAEQFNSKEEAILIDTQGTYHFMSPTAIGGDKRNAFYDDVWAMGIILYAFIYGTVPFFHPLDYQLFESIQKDELQIPDNEVLSASENVRDLIKKLLTKKDEDRIPLKEICKHKWYDGYIHPEYIMEEEEEEEEANDNNDGQRDAFDEDAYTAETGDTCCVAL